MKKIILMLIIVSATQLTQAQQVLDSENMEAPQWAELMKDGDLSFEEIVALHEAWWEGKEITPGCGWKPFKRWEASMQHRLGADGKVMQGGEIKRQWEEVRDFSLSRSPAGNWLPLGPILDGVTTREHIRGVGRTSCMAFHPTDANIIFVGTASGGLWRTYDGGDSWVSNTDDLPSLGVSAAAFDPFNPNVVYIGTGDRDASDAPGLGVMKSTDAGITWEFMNSGMENLVVGDILVDPETPETIFAATNDGIFRSTDGAATWTYSSPNATDYRDIKFKPGDSDVMYATSNGKFYRSLDNGINWDWINEGIQSAQRMVIGVTPANPEVVYVCGASTYEFHKFYRSEDGGSTFTTMSDEPNILGWAADGSGSGGQAWYDFCMAADPIDEWTVYVGGVRMKKSIDGGVTWLDVNPGYLHVDQHECHFSPHNDDLYLANDGGFYQYVNNNDWLDLSNGIVNGQIYKMGQSPHAGVKALTGFQDNGTSEYTGTQWKRRGGGDGFECYYDPSDPEWHFFSLYYGQVYRTGPEVSSQKISGNGELGIDESGAWISPHFQSPSDPNTIFLGLKNVWRSTNVKHAEKDSIVWVKTSNNLGGNNSTNMIALVPSRANPETVYCSQGNSKFYRTDYSMEEEVNWLNLSSFLDLTSSAVLCIETHYTDQDIVYIGYDNKVWISENRGVAWEDISGTLPDIRINTIALDKNSDEGLYVGTDMGVYYKDNTMDDWVPFMQGLPMSVRVTELEIYSGEGLADSRLRAATYGRGLWESDLFDAETYPFPAAALLQTPSGSQEVYAEFELDVLFYKNLQTVGVTGFTEEDVFVNNGSVTGITGGPQNFVLTVSPDTYGPVAVYIENDAAEDNDGLLTLASDTLKLLYNPEPEAFGIFGPGGVGDQNTIPLWLRADRGAMSAGNAAVEAGPVDELQDQSGNGEAALQSNSDAQPIYLSGTEGINGRSVVKFDGENDYLEAQGIVPGENLSVVSVVEADEIAFNTHGWIASARQPNGFVLHPWEEESRYSSMVIDNEDNYSNGPVNYIGDAAAPHIYGVVFERTEYYQIFRTLFDDNNWEWGGSDIGARDGTAAVDIRFGWDYDERFGAGKIAEHFIFNRRIHESHRLIVSNYLGAKYAIDLGLAKRYGNWDKNYEVAGIGQETFYDKHLDAQGTGLIRMTAAGSPEDGSYVMWGHDNESMEWTTNSYPILTGRVDRQWGVEHTGAMGLVTVSIDEAALPAESGLGLIVGSSSEFIPGESVDFYPFELNSGVYSAQVDFPELGAFTIGVQPSVGVEDISKASLNLYPNPAGDIMTLSVEGLSSAHYTVKVVDAAGKEVYFTEFEGSSMQLNLKGIASGTYVVVLTSELGVFKERMVKY